MNVLRWSHAMNKLGMASYKEVFFILFLFIGATTVMLAFFSLPGMATEYQVNDPVAGGMVNMRSGPGLDHEVIATIPAGTPELEVSGCQDPDDNGRSTKPWCHVDWSGNSGWTSSCCISPSSGGPDLAVDSSGALPSGSAASIDETPATECDRLAGAPKDPDLPADVSGQAFDYIIAGQAIAICGEDAERYPDSRRIAFELGRALEANENYDAARKQYQKAARQGSSYAMNAARKWYRKADPTANCCIAPTLAESSAETSGHRVLAPKEVMGALPNLVATHFSCLDNSIRGGSGQIMRGVSCRKSLTREGVKVSCKENHYNVGPADGVSTAMQYCLRRCAGGDRGVGGCPDVDHVVGKLDVIDAVRFKYGRHLVGVMGLTVVLKDGTKADCTNIYREIDPPPGQDLLPHMNRIAVDQEWAEEECDFSKYGITPENSFKPEP